MDQLQYNVCVRVFVCPLHSLQPSFHHLGHITLCFTHNLHLLVCVCVFRWVHDTSCVHGLHLFILTAPPKKAQLWSPPSSLLLIRPDFSLHCAVFLPPPLMF